ncbi:MAG: T9SS type A sorting domain-containing protein [Saprospiraceae bacterium]|nr:T9SS type A sorting domain-containing protein [Saprospiraceae bacterium]
MQLFKKITCLLLSIPMIGLAQQGHNHKFCGVDAHMNQSIKERMLRERAAVSPQEIEAIRNSRASINIPITFTNVGDNNGNGYTDMDKIFDVFCALNDGYASMDVHFHMNLPIRFLDNSILYNNAFSNSVDGIMAANDIPNTLNAFVGPSINDPAASYYTPSADCVFLLNSQIDGAGGGKTTRHEVGHFFSLPHTFSGWEGSDVEADYGCDPVPATVSMGWFNLIPENFARTGSDANCSTRGDGFCDTEADYYANREPCNMVACIQDPLGNTLTPDKTNIMSYFGDDCVDGFSTEQESAVITNITQRGWTNFTPPTTAELTGTVNLNVPTSVNVVSSNTVTLSWDAMPNATGYYVEVSRSIGGSVIPPFFVQELVYTGTSVEVDANLFTLNNQYIIKVRPFNAYYACNGHTGSAIFLASDAVASSVQTTTSNNLSMQLLSNPVRTDEIQLEIDAEKMYNAQLALYAIDGRVLSSNPAIHIEQGSQTQSINVAGLADGMYVVVLTTEEGVLQQKVMLRH